ncbi:hypothetical protein BH24CHL6_BH24CHL6_04710 [soil metagenome]
MVGRTLSVPARALTRTSLSFALATALSVVLATQALAATWTAPIPLTSSGDVFRGDLVGLGSSTVVAVYAETPFESERVYVRRSVNSGASWGPATLLSGRGLFPAIAGRGMNVDVIWNASNGRVRYARSTDGGASFAPSVALSPAGRFAWRPAVARGPGGRVAVVWEDVQNGRINVRVSKNGGASFAPAKVIATAGEESGVDVAIGKGVIYVAYVVGSGGLRVKSSLDSGGSWSGAARITNRFLSDRVSLTAAGSHAYISFTVPNSGFNFSKIRYRRTTDRGANWSRPRDLSPANWTTYDGDIALQGGVLRATFVRCTTEFDICVNNRVFYRQSSDGRNWTTPQRVSPRSVFDAWEPRVGFAGKILVLYTGDTDAGANLYVRRGSP